MTTDRASRSPTVVPCLRPSIALNRLVIAQLAARVLASQLRLGLSSDNTVAPSRSSTRRLEAPGYEFFCPAIAIILREENPNQCVSWRLISRG
jgi:hypothetical protein